MLSLLLLSIAPAAAEPALSWRGELDLPVIAAAGTTWALLYLAVEPGMLPTGERWQARGVDGLVEPHLDPGSALASDILLYGGMAGSAGLAVLSARLDDDAPWSRAGVVLETFAVDGMLTETLKLAVRRPRPYTALPTSEWPDTDGVDASMSFPSGHASFAAAMSFAAARTWQLSGAGPGALWLGYGAATALTGSVAALRVAAGMHHPTDVLAGAVLGACTGWLVPTLHENDRVRLAAAPGGLAVSGDW